MNAITDLFSFFFLEKKPQQIIQKAKLSGENLPKPIQLLRIMILNIAQNRIEN